MVEKPTIPGYYRFRVGKDWFIDFYYPNSRTADFLGGYDWANVSEIVGPIDPRPDSPQPAPDEVEALAEKLYISTSDNGPQTCFMQADYFIQFRNARRKEAAQKHPPTQIEVEFYLGMGARQIHEYKQLRDILGVHHSAGMFDVLMRLCSSGYIENNLLKYFKPNEEQTK